jgi:hypothetical protein
MPSFRLLALALSLFTLAASGCELVADFDRGKIPSDAAVPRDAKQPPDIAEDAGPEDAG